MNLKKLFEGLDMNPNWLDVAGLISALAGAVVLAFGLFASRAHALKIGVPRMAEESDDKNICLPQVRDEIRKSRFALVGLLLLAMGFVLQIVGNWPGM